MKKRTVYIGLLIVFVLLSVLLMGCESANLPPSISYVQSRYQNYSKEIQIIIDFLSFSDYEDVYITRNDGTMLADLSEISIEDPLVVNAIEKIINDEGYQHINKNGDTISLLQWTGVRDIGCGIACSINESATPEIEYMTQLVPLSDGGWFYYVSDYTTWRNTQ